MNKYVYWNNFTWWSVLSFQIDELIRFEAHTDIHPLDVSMMKPPDSNIDAVWPSPPPIFSVHYSSITELSVHYSDEKENLKMWVLCVLQLKVLRVHQVNICWLVSEERNLINMSSGCLFSVSFNALPTQTPTHMNKVQACMYSIQTNTQDTNMVPCKDVTVHTLACTHAHVLPCQDLSRQAVPTGWAKIMT